MSEGSGGNAHQTMTTMTAPTRFREEDESTAETRKAEPSTLALRESKSKEIDDGDDDDLEHGVRGTCS